MPRPDRSDESEHHGFRPGDVVRTPLGRWAKLINYRGKNDGKWNAYYMDGILEQTTLDPRYIHLADE